MKIPTNRIKRWGFKQRLFEIQQRLIKIEENIQFDDKIRLDVLDALSETRQILNYWMEHMAGDVEKTEKKKRTKPINLWA